MSGPTRSTDVLLLRAVDYRDADRVVTLLSRELGKVGALARGARRSRKRFGGALEPCCVIRAELARGRGSLWRLAEARVERPFPGILTDLDRIAVAGAAMELLREAVPEDHPDERLFDDAVGFLEALADGAPPEELHLSFQLRVMALVGFLPSLERCAGCDREASPEQAALFDPVRGAIVCRACGGAAVFLSGATRARLLRALEQDWVETERWSEQERDEAGRSLGPFIEAHLGRRLAAGAVLEQIRRRTHREDAPE